MLELEAKHLLILFLNPLKKSLAIPFLTFIKNVEIGDIKHSYADITPLKRLGYSPQFNIHSGINAYVSYSKIVIKKSKR